MGALTATTAIRHLAADAWSLSRLWATVLGILAALTFGFVVGRIWQIRCDELGRRAGFALPPVARIPQPTNAET
jgi:hypothetical protein